MIRLAMCLAVCSALLCGAADARVRLDLKYQGYTVRGMSVPEIWRDIFRKGPHQRERGLYAQAQARISYGWDIDFQQSRGVCRVRAADVNVRVRILLPAWADEKRGGKVLRASWRRYAALVRAHENHHKDIARAAARDIDALFAGARARGSCAALGRDLQARAERILARERQAQLRFDATDPPIVLQ
jgi:predicted secreted Zn-dependent protease